MAALVTGARMLALLATVSLSWAVGCGHAPTAPRPAVAGTNARAVSRAAAPVFVSPSSYEAFIRGELHAARGEHARAIEHYRAAIDLGDADPFAIAKLAEELDRAGRGEEARELLQRASEKHPASEPLALALARVHRRGDDAERALAGYAHAEELASSADTALERVSYLRELGHHERALEALHALEQHGGRGARDQLRIEIELALLERDHRELARCARDWLALGGRDPQLTRRAASALLEAGQHALTLELLGAVPATEGDARLRLKASLALGRTAECEHLLSSVPPHWLGGPLAMGEAYLAAGLPEEALRVLSESTSGSEDAGSAARRRQLIARSLVEAGRAQEAAKLLGSASEARAATCEALQASGLAALARDAGCAQ